MIIKKTEDGVYRAYDEEEQPLFTARQQYNWYSSNGTSNYKWSILGNISARPDKLAGKDIPIGSIFIDWNNGDAYIMMESGWQTFGS